ncbi:beta-lactamase-like protein [Polychytrium aggregatum]|uniref:beta-lactamase-like protein n=1 Tax=Polychytrium aggregatum TaxID=110093 RepID=UPI0022FDEA22|nr:beta-lactamase-like protein [Polychytrium aggregatum]KAI9208710.1 beta-lactamase-like protein [Polychytrium aggregatum]
MGPAWLLTRFCRRFQSSHSRRFLSSSSPSPQDRTPRDAGRETFQVLIANQPSFANTSAVLVRFRERSYLFNCPETLSRLGFEYALEPHWASHVFLTRLDNGTFGGFPGLLLTKYDIGPTHLHGGNGLASMVSELNQTHFIDRTALASLSTVEVNDGFQYQDHYLSIDTVHAWPNLNPSHTISAAPAAQTIGDPSDVQKHDGPERRPGESISYICRGPSRRGRFDPAAASRLGVKNPRDYGRLARGEAVTAEDGSIVHPHQVLVGETRRGYIFCIVDCPSPTHIDSITCSPKWPLETSTAGTGVVDLVIHMLGDKVIEDSRYVVWMNAFGSHVRHVILSSKNSPHPVPFRSYATFQRIAHQAHRGLFPLPHHTTEPEQSLESVPGIPKTAQVGHIGMCFDFQNSEIVIRNESDPRSLRGECAATPPAEPASLAANASTHGIIVSPLGTGSTAPTTFRNVSSLLVTLSGGKRILLDCGEGTLGQLFLLHGGQDFDRILVSIRCLFVSHIHADHHLGIFGFIQARAKALQQYEGPLSSLFIVGPPHLLGWITSFAERLCIPLDQVVLLSSVEVAQSPGIAARPLQSELEVLSFQPVAVNHCRHSYGLVLIDRKMNKIVYSGDCRPTPALIQAGAYADILIHEATFDSENSNEARERRHSTVSEAIQAGCSMGAKRLLLTHFSRRFGSHPTIPSDLKAWRSRAEMQVGLAFDLMSIRTDDFAYLEKATRSIPAMAWEFQETTCPASPAGARTMGSNATSVVTRNLSPA